MKADWRKNNPVAAKQARVREKIRRDADPLKSQKRAANYQRNKLIWLNSMRRKRYGVGNMEVTAMLDRQGHRCPITLEPVNITSCLDHCHQTGKVRAILSKRANIMLGFMERDPIAFAKALDYLKQHGGDHESVSGT